MMDVLECWIAEYLNKPQEDIAVSLHWEGESIGVIGVNSDAVCCKSKLALACLLIG